MTIAELDQRVREELCDERLEVYWHKKKNDPRRVIVTCSPSIYSKGYEIGFNGKPKDFEQDIIDRLQTRISANLGRPVILGEHTKLVEHGYVGSCAEPHAANLVLKNNTGSVIDDFVFSPAYLFQNSITHKKYCMHCLLTFDQLDNE